MSTQKGEGVQVTDKQCNVIGYEIHLGAENYELDERFYLLGYNAL
jgi:hypothetical protein